METVNSLCMHSKLLRFGVGMYLSCQVTSLFPHPYPSMVDLSPEKQICFASLGSLSIFQHQVGSGIFLHKIPHIRTEN